MKSEFYKLLRTLLLTIITSITFSFSFAQRIYIDTVTYEGTLKFKATDFRYNIKGLKALLET